MRLKIPSKRHDRAFFTQLEQRLREIPSIESAVLTPETAGMLLQFAEGEGDGVAAALEALKIVAIAQGHASAPAMTEHQAPSETGLNAREVDAQGQEHSPIDRRALAFTVLMLLLLRQILRGGWWAPGLALLWLLFEVLRARMTPGADSPAGQPTGPR
jgi:hypothetical protein